MPIQQIFPQPIYISKLDRALTKEELRAINKHKKKMYKNEGNTTSNDNYVLENKTLQNLKKDLNKQVLDYFDKVICTTNSITPYITQSWLNYTQPNQYHHRHYHSNSYASGILYIDADKEVDSVVFFKMDDVTLELSVTKHNMFNATSWKFPVAPGDLFIFPSRLHHAVEKKKGTNTRVSLSFNVFFKGEIGLKSDLTALTI